MEYERGDYEVQIQVMRSVAGDLERVIDLLKDLNISLKDHDKCDRQDHLEVMRSVDSLKLDHSGIQKVAFQNKLPLDLVLCENSVTSNRTTLRKAMLEIGVIYACAECDNDGTWRGKRLALHIDHKNGIGNDNRIENLRFLCPNCHQQTPTWGRRKK